MKLKPFIVACFLLCFLSNLNGQNFNYPKDRDFRLWLKGSIEYQHSKYWKVEFERHLRTSAKSSFLHQCILQGNVALNPNWDIWFIRRWRIAGGVRHKLLNDRAGGEQGFENSFRLHGDLSSKYEIGRLSCAVRYRIQRSLPLPNNHTVFNYPSTDYRIKHVIGYNFRNWKWDPYFTLESFSHVEIGEYSAKWYNPITSWRIRIHTDWTPSKKQKIRVFYQREWETLYFDPEIIHVLGINYSVRTGRKSKN